MCATCISTTSCAYPARSRWPANRSTCRASTVPAYLVASRDDHIVPWRSAYRTTRLLGGDTTFVLGASGHIAGIINPPEQNRRNYWTNSAHPGRAGAWFDRAVEPSGELVAALARLARAARRRPASRAAGAGQRPLSAARRGAGTLRPRKAGLTADAPDRRRAQRAKMRAHKGAARPTPQAVGRSHRHRKRRENMSMKTPRVASGHRRHGRPRRGNLHQARRARLQGGHDALARKHEGEGLARQHEQDGLRLQAYACDVTDWDSCVACAQKVTADVGPIDVLVNNAGITRDTTFKKMDRANWEAVIKTNLDSCFNMTKQVCDGMIGSRLGTDHQHLVGERTERRVRPGQLRGGQGRHARLHQVAGARGRAQGRHRQHDLAGIHRHQDGDGDPARRCSIRRSFRRFRSAGSASPRRSPGSSRTSRATKRPS